jgi:putative membrane protein
MGLSRAAAPETAVTETAAADAGVGTRAAPGTLARAVPVVLAAAVVALQIVYPLVTAGPARDRLTVVIVVVFAAASLSHATVWRGPRFATALFVITALGGLLVEAVGVSTGLPFGEYDYRESLGAQLLGVPVVVALAWTMMAYPAYAVSRVLGGGWLRRALSGGWALAAWDLFLDPQMVQAGHWQWRDSGPALAGIPVSNHIAWFAVASVMMLALHTSADGGGRVDDRIPLGLYLWTFASSVLAHAAFFGLPTSAVTGGIGMGVVVLALTRASRRRPR